LLQATDIRFAYDRAPVLRGVSLEVPRGSLVGILGPNGSGKTTLLRVLAGVLRPANGVVRFDGRDIRTIGQSALARRLAFVPQRTHPAFDYTVLEIALMGRYPHLGPFALEGPGDLAAARAALAATGTAHLESRPFHTLSGGEQQRVAIASALAQLDGDGGGAPARPDRSRAGTAGADGACALLLDEPTTALDPRYQIEIASILRRLGESGLTIVLSTHDLNLAAVLCHTLVLLREGEILAAGPSVDVLTPPLVRQLYDVDAIVAREPSTGRMFVMPWRRAGREPEQVS
jgi:iron complex transport system ATP-binding protein